MTEIGAISSGPLNDYTRIYTPKSLLLRYANGRIRHFASRQIFSVAVGCILWFLVSPKIVALAMALVLLGDVVDCLFLRFLPRLLERGHSLSRVKLFSGLTAGLHSLTIAVCVWLAWHPPHNEAEPLFAIGLLISATVNGGIVLPYNRIAGIVRLTLYALTPLAILSFEMWGSSTAGSHIHISLAGLAILYILMMWLISFLTSNFDRTQRHMKDQFEQWQQLEVSNALLLEQQQEARRLALVAEHANDSVILLDRDGHITWANDAFTRITGFTFSEAVGQRPRDLMDVRNTDAEAVRKLVVCRGKGLPLRITLRSRHKDGTLMWLETNQVPVFDQNGKVEMFIAVERDVTKAHHHEEQMKKARSAAEKGERVKTEFLATMSHEIRTPMNGVIGMAQMLEGTSLDADQRLYTDTILSSARTLLDLINDVLDLSKLDAEKMSFSPVDFDIRACFQETLRILQIQAQKKGLLLVLEVPDDIPQRVHGDDSRIRQILLNLVGNAIKFTGSGEVRVKLDIQAQENALQLSIVVVDTGIGIPADKLEHVFERFSQAETATTRRYGGTGLGLTISRKLAQAMGGEITVSSELGVGSCFTVSLQLTTAQTPVVAQLDTTVAEIENPSVRAGMRVLVAEDNKVNRLVMRKFLRDVPIELEFAHNGSEAVEKAQAMKPDLVFMDMSMPVMSGIDATRAIRSNGGAQPVIVALTGNAFDSDRDACLQAGMDEFLSKPLNRVDVLAVLQRHGTGI